MKTKTIPALAGLLLALASAPHAGAQETIVALGRVNSAGDLISGASPGGAIATSRPATGEYHVVVTAPGAFAGTGIGEYIPQATVRIGAPSDRAVTAEIADVTDDALTAVFYVSDLEDATNLSGPEPVNYSFQFAIHRIPAASTAVPAASRHLYAVGSVASNGDLKQAVVSDGAALSVSHPGDGDYLLHLTKAGAFAGYDLEDFLVFVTSASVLHVGDRVGVGTASSMNADELHLSVKTADVQNASDTNPLAQDDEFHFAVYRINAPPHPAPESALLLGMASVQGSNGLLRRGVTSYPGGSITANRSGAGRYSIEIFAPGRFAGKTLDDFAVQVQLNNSSHIDRHANVRPNIIGPDSIQFNIRVNDLENDGESFGVAEDNDFFVVIHEAFATDRPDLRIGRGPALGGMRGDNRYNTNAAGQRIRAKMRKSGAFRFFFAAENDGSTIRSLRVRGRAGKGLKSVRCFRLTGGRANVTAACLAGGHLADSLRPGMNVRYEARAVLPTRSKQRRSQFRVVAIPGTAAAPPDANVAWSRRK